VILWVDTLSSLRPAIAIIVEREKGDLFEPG
jgi:hypothetical protein